MIHLDKYFGEVRSLIYQPGRFPLTLPLRRGHLEPNVDVNETVGKVTVVPI